MRDIVQRNLHLVIGALSLMLGLSLASQAMAATVELRPIVDQIQGIVITIAGVLATWIAGQISVFLRSKLKLTGLQIDDQVQSVLSGAATNAINWAFAKIDASGKTSVEVQNAVVAMAVNYMLTRVPEAVDHFGLGTQELTQFLEAKLAHIGFTGSNAAAAAIVQAPVSAAILAVKPDDSGTPALA